MDDKTRLQGAVTTGLLSSYTESMYGWTILGLPTPRDDCATRTGNVGKTVTVA